MILSPNLQNCDCNISMNKRFSCIFLRFLPFCTILPILLLPPLLLKFTVGTKKARSEERTFGNNY